MSVLQTMLDDLEEFILPAQFFDAIRTRTPSCGEYRLAFAVLADGLNCFLRYAKSKTVAEHKLFSDARDWILSTTDRGLFGFENLCDTFGIEPNLLRGALMKMEPDALVSRVPRQVASRRHKAPELLRRSMSRKKEDASSRGPSRAAFAIAENDGRLPVKCSIGMANP